MSRLPSPGSNRRPGPVFRAAQLAADIPDLREQITVFPGKLYQPRQRTGSHVLAVLAAEGRIRRSRPASSWAPAPFRWTSARPLIRIAVADARTAWPAAISRRSVRSPSMT
ncbi:hypothetical protein [Streptomyces monashensis]|uniref:hypothetical protein n=1 Tax=Streptomyces monashensis TaxID=1678012 RepID=UPI003183691F